MLIPSLKYVPKRETSYEPDLFVLRSDLLLLAFHLVLENNDHVTMDEISTGVILPEILANMKKLASFIATCHHLDDELALALELPWDLVTFHKIWDSWEDHGFVVVDEQTNRVFLTHAGLKRIQYLLESERFASLFRDPSIHSPEIRGLGRIFEKQSTNVTLSSFISFMITPPSHVKQFFLIILGYLSFFSSIFLILSGRASMQNVLGASSDALLISALAIAATLTFTVITYILYRWIMMLRTRQPHVWNNLERVVSSEFLVFLNLMTLGASSLYLVLHQLPQILSFSPIILASLLFTVTLSIILIIYQLSQVKRSFIFQRMFYQQLHEIFSESGRSRYDADYLASFFSEESHAIELLQRLAKKIDDLSNRSLLGFIWQGSNYMVLYYVLMITYIAFEGLAMLLGKFMLSSDGNPIRVHSMVALVAGMLFAFGYFMSKTLIRHHLVDRLFLRVFSQSFKVEFYLRNILHDFLYAIHDPEDYQKLRQKAATIVTRFFEIFVLFSLVTISGYELTYSFVARIKLIPPNLVYWLPFLFLLEATLLVIIYALLGTITWLTTVEIPLNDLDVRVNRLFKESSASFVESVFHHYLLTPVLYQRILTSSENILLQPKGTS